MPLGGKQQPSITVGNPLHLLSEFLFAFDNHAIVTLSIQKKYQNLKTPKVKIKDPCPLSQISPRGTAWALAERLHPPLLGLLSSLPRLHCSCSLSNLLFAPDLGLLLFETTSPCSCLSQLFYR